MNQESELLIFNFKKLKTNKLGQFKKMPTK